MKPIYIPGFPGSKIHLDNRHFLYFGGTSYLGIQTLPEFQQLLIDDIRQYGTNYGASRISNIRLEIYNKTEEYLSKWVGSEASIVLSSGFLAGQLLARYFNPKDYKLFYSTHTHASLYSDDREAYANYVVLRKELIDYLNSNDKRTPVVLLDTIDFSSGAFPKFKGLNDLPLDSCIVIADDSHGIGLVGTEGSGSFRQLKEMLPMELLVCSSFGKTMGVQAGAVFGTSSRLDALRETSLYIGASPPAPALMSTLLKAAPIYAAQRSILFALLEKFHNSLNHPEKFRYMHRYPVYESDDHKLSAYLSKEGIFVTDFDYPAEIDSWQCRLVINAQHGPDDISTLAEKINSYYSLHS
ncbi:MAG: aminotransferase class I/II-fold pyridoxal phosphate-dependent enzyme [Flavobacteriaceae bacterium]